MITLYQPPPAWGLPCISPFCVKLESYLRLAKLDYKIQKPDVVEFAKTDLSALSEILEDQSYFLGDRVTGVDASIFGILIHILWVPWNCPVKEHGLALKNLMDYCNRMKQIVKF